MPSPQELAETRIRRQQRIAEDLTTEARKLWRRIDRARIAESWLALVQDLIVLFTAAQIASANGAEEYIAGALAAQGISADPDGTFQPRALAGVASDGRPLDSLLYQPAVASLTGIQVGAPVADALSSGWALMETIALTQIADVGRAALAVGIGQRRGLGGYVRQVVGKTCGRCVVLAGRWYRWNTGFKRHPRCFPAGVAISGPRSEAATRRWFEGELVVLTTASGQQLPLTGNHPVLTSRGWVPANLLQEGDDVVRSTRPQGATALMVPNHDQVPALIEDVWGALGVAGFDRMPTASEYFHGDGDGGEIDVVYADGPLGLSGETTFGEQARQQGLTVGLVLPAPLVLQSTTELVDLGHAAHPGHTVGRRSLSPPVLGGHLCGARSSSFARAATFDSGLFESCSDDIAGDAVLAGQGVLAGSRQISRRDGFDRQIPSLTRWDAPGDAFTVETAEGYTRLGRDLLDRLAGQVELDRVVELRRVEWSGHVYSLTSSEGWHSANSLIVSNCDCIHIPAREDVAGDLTTDPRAWFDSLSKAEQDKQFTKAGAEAIRMGADIGRVVNSRRGAYGLQYASDIRRSRTDFAGLRGREGRGQLTRTQFAGRDLFLTSEAVTKRGINRPVRLMPESVLEIADTREEAIRLLRVHGYIR